MRILVLGGYGLIGSAVVRECLARGWTVTGAGRNPDRGRCAIPGAEWVAADLARLTRPDDWSGGLDGYDAVINCAGALQDGGGDDLWAVHHTGIAALVAACAAASVPRFVQISAPGAEPDAATEFMRTKAAGDAWVRESPLHWAILKPGLVLSPHAWGGSALLRGLAALPFAIPLTHADAPAQTVSVFELAREAADCAAGLRPPGYEADLVEEKTHTLAELVTAFRDWLGFRRVPIAALPDWVSDAAGLAGDLAADLGWKTPLRSTAMRTMGAGVTGDASAWTAARGSPPSTLAQTLGGFGADIQARRFARTYFLHPVLIAGLSVFWIVSGLIAVFQRDAAAAILTAQGVGLDAALALTLSGAALDIALGAGIAVRRTSSLALMGTIALTLAYAASATVITPHLWADPMGTLVKMLPIVLAALAALAMNGSER
ncbi:MULTISPECIES: SDR family oxidoreductase [Hyphobacterium]|uniref:SDR family oxidoreductase n=1 Tax=Hyphobacterium vulgare TaxID=1736751 RepID=A0ABV7A0K9_9PROT